MDKCSPILGQFYYHSLKIYFYSILGEFRLQFFTHSNSYTNEFVGNTAYCLPFICSTPDSTPDDNTEALLTFEYNGNEIIPTGVEFYQNLLTIDWASVPVPRNISRVCFFLLFNVPYSATWARDTLGLYVY